MLFYILILNLELSVGFTVLSSDTFVENSNNTEHFRTECKVIKTEKEVFVDCSGRNLTYVPSFPKFTTSLDLSNNAIVEILNSSVFNGMSLLQRIDLSDNPLEEIAVQIFSGLQNLTELIIRNSMLHKQDRSLIIDDLIADLGKLRYFSFTFKLPISISFTPVICELLYRTQPFGKINKLHSVEKLEIDSALLKFETNAASTVIFNTTSLHVINGFVCFYDVLNKKMFDYFPFLKELIIQCPFFVKFINDDFVSAQFLLREFSIYGANLPHPLEVDMIYNVTKSVSRAYDLSSLTINGISNHNRQEFICGYHFYDLTALHSLTTLNLEANSLFLQYSHVLPCDQFPSSLTYMNIDDNCIDSININLNILQNNKQLEIISAKRQNNCAFVRIPVRVAHNIRNIYKEKRVYSLKEMVLTNSIDKLDFGEENDFYPNLTYVDLSLNSNTMNNIIPRIFCSRRPHLRYLNISNSKISYIEKSSFSNCSHLELSDLSTNSIGNVGCDLADRFISLISLTDFSLKRNSIKCIKQDLLNSMMKIKIFDISHNLLQTVNISIQHTQALQFLNFSHNRIQKLSENNMHDLDVVASSREIKIDLSGNTMLCTCETLHFLQWNRNKCNLTQY